MITKRFSIFSVVALCLFYSCVTTYPTDGYKKKMRDPSFDYILILKSGEKITGRSLTRAFDKKSEQAYSIINGRTIYDGDVFSYQNKLSVSFRYEKPNTLHAYTWIALLSKGKINLYHSAERGTRDSYNDHYYFKKNENNFQELFPVQAAALFEDNKEAYAKFNSYFKVNENRYKQFDARKLIDVVEFYNK